MKTLTIKEADPKTGEETTLRQIPATEALQIINMKQLITPFAKKVKSGSIFMLTLDVFDGEKRLVTAVIKDSDFDDDTVESMLESLVLELANKSLL